MSIQRNNAQQNRSNKSVYKDTKERVKTSFLSSMFSLKEIVYNIIDIAIPKNNYFYDDRERPFSREIMRQRQYYPGNYCPPSSLYAGKEERKAYMAYYKNHDMYLEEEIDPRNDTSISEEPKKARGLSKKVQLKFNSAINQAGTTIGNKTSEIALGVGEIMNEGATVLTQKAKTSIQNVGKKASKQTSNQTDNQISKSSQSTQSPTEKVVGFNLKEAYNKGVDKSNKIDFDIDFDIDYKQDIIEIEDLKNLKTPLKFDTLYHTIITSPISFDVDSLTPTNRKVTQNDLKGKKGITINQQKLKPIIEDVLLILPTKSTDTLSIVPLKAQTDDIEYRKVNITTLQCGEFELSDIQFITSEIYIHGKQGKPINLLFSISSEEL